MKATSHIPIIERQKPHLLLRECTDKCRHRRKEIANRIILPAAPPVSRRSSSSRCCNNPTAADSRVFLATNEDQIARSDLENPGFTLRGAFESNEMHG